MFYLLVFFVLSGQMVDEDAWSRNKTFLTLEACTNKRLELQKLIDIAYAKDKEKDASLSPLVFKCVERLDRMVMKSKEEDANSANREKTKYATTVVRFERRGQNDQAADRSG